MTILTRDQVLKSVTEMLNTHLGDTYAAYALEPVLWNNGDPLDRAWLCPMTVHKGEYVMNTGNNLYRKFTDADLPDCIKDVLSIVKSYAQSTGLISNNLNLYALPAGLPKEYQSIGWQAEAPAGMRCSCCVTEMYMIVLNKAHVEQLKGVREF
jgi:hypothetical protein